MKKTKFTRILSVALLVMLLFNNQKISAQEVSTQQSTQDEIDTAWELENNKAILEALSHTDVSQIPSPYWDYVVQTATGLSISSSGMATASSYILGEASTVKKINTYMYLQKKNGYTSYETTYDTIAGGTWDVKTNSYISTFERYKQLYDHGTYITLAVHYVYANDGSKETIISPSYEEVY